MFRHTLLYVDDDPPSAMLMERIVENIPNLKIIFSSNAESALEQAAARQPDLIFMDIVLPGMNGLEACLRLLANEATRSIPVVAISASAMRNDIERAIDVGFRRYLTKPVNINEVLNVIKASLKWSLHAECAVSTGAASHPHDI